MSFHNVFFSQSHGVTLDRRVYFFVEQTVSSARIKAEIWTNAGGTVPSRIMHVFDTHMFHVESTQQALDRVLRDRDAGMYPDGSPLFTQMSNLPIESRINWLSLIKTDPNDKQRRYTLRVDTNGDETNIYLEENT